LQHARNESSDAEAAYQEALAIRRNLADANPDVWLQYVAGTLNNLANLQGGKKEFVAAEAGYQEAWEIYHRLAEAHPEIYTPDAAMIAVTMSIFYLNMVQDREKSLAYAREALMAAMPFVKLVPVARKHVENALLVVETWKLDREVFIREIQVLLQ
jgi:tetratricopeptide (TPR) repeat protein